MAPLLFAVLTALIYRLRGGGFGINDWRPDFLHSRYIAFLLQTALFVVLFRFRIRHPWWQGLIAGILWLFAVTPAWGPWFDIGTSPAKTTSDPTVSWIHGVLDVLFGSSQDELPATGDVWRDATGMVLRGLFFLPLLASIHRPSRWKRLAILSTLWLLLYTGSHAVYRHLWTDGLHAEFYVGFVLGLLTFPPEHADLGIDAFASLE
jgi:hypothetical protein